MTIPTYQLELLEANSDLRFGIVEDGVARKVDGTVIPLEHIAYQKMPADGQYYLSAATCSGTCSVGEPKPKCVKSGIYCPPKCAVYFFRKDLEEWTVSVGVALAMVDSVVSEQQQVIEDLHNEIMELHAGDIHKVSD